MKLANIRHEGRRGAALVIGEEVLGLSESAGGQVRDVRDLLALEDGGRSLIERCKRHSPRIPLTEVELLPAVRWPDKILGVGMNYHSFVAAAAEAGIPLPRAITWFMRPRGCLAGARDEVWLPAGAEDLDYEAELAVIIGRACRHVPPAEAREVIAGYAVANDLTLRERVLKSVPLGKCFDTHCPLGPWIVTADELGDPYRLAMKTWVNGALRQSGNTSDMIVRGEELVVEISKVTTLRPGDVLLTGTPAGSGIFQRPPSSLSVGDRVRIEIEGIGSIDNEVVAEPPAVEPLADDR